MQYCGHLQKYRLPLYRYWKRVVVLTVVGCLRLFGILRAVQLDSTPFIHRRSIRQHPIRADI